jgi:hypothetical protein
MYLFEVVVVVVVVVVAVVVVAAEGLFRVRGSFRKCHLP